MSKCEESIEDRKGHSVMERHTGPLQSQGGGRAHRMPLRALTLAALWDVTGRPVRSVDLTVRATRSPEEWPAEGT